MNQFISFSLAALIVSFCPPAEAQSVKEQALKLYESGDASGALRLIDEELVRMPDDLELLKLKGRILIETDDHDAAIRVFGRLLNLAPQDIEIRKRLAELYLWKELTSEALYHYEQILKITPEDPLILKRVAELYSYQDKQEQAIPIYEKLAEIAPDDIELLMTLYNHYIWTDRHEKGLAILTKIHEKDPNNLEIKRQLAQQYLWMGREKEAIKTYEELIISGLREAEFFKKLGELYEWNDRPVDALKMYEKYLAIKPWDREILHKSANLSKGLGMKMKATKHLKMILKADPVDTSAKETYEQLVERTLSNFTAAYTLFSDSIGFYRHRVALKFFHPQSDFISFDVYYVLQHFRGREPVTYIERTLYANGGGGSLYFNLPEHLSIKALVSGNYYEQRGSSFNGGLIISKDFAFPLSLGVYFLREDNITTIGAIQNEIVENRVGLKFYGEPFKIVFTYSDGGYGRLSDNNNHFYFHAGLGLIAVRKPSLRIGYEFSYDAYENQPADASYFAPDDYQVHALGIYFNHEVSQYFSFGLRARPWYALRDEAFLLAYGADIGIRPHKRHLLKFEFLRTDTLSGRALALYQENLFGASWMFRF